MARHGSSEGRLTTRWSRPGQPGLEFGAILALAGRAAHLEAVRPPLFLLNARHS